MNLHAIASGAISAVNPMTAVTILESTGYTMDGARQVPSYAAPVMANCQVQALSQSDLRHLDGLNIQGVDYAVFLPGRWSGVIRAKSKGGDLLQFRGATWLVTAVLEQWPDWTRVAVTRQNGS